MNSSSRSCLPVSSQERHSKAVAKLEAGLTYETWFPFKREEWTEFTPEGHQDHATWVPGWNMEGRDIGYGEAAFDAKWDGEGAMLLIIVSLHKPGPTYPERAFYIRQWRDPEGKVFGKRNLRVLSSRALVGWLNGTKTEHLEHDRAKASESSRALFLEALMLAGSAHKASPQGNSGRPK